MHMWDMELTGIAAADSAAPPDRRPFRATASGGSVVFRAFGFVDASGFTTVLETDADQALAALRGMRAVVRATTQLHRVRIAKWLGDGAMLVAVEPSTLLRCLDEIWHEAPHHCSLPLHGGMASGKVLILEGDDYVGRAVNVAARLCAAAGPGVLLLASDAGESPSDPQLVQRRL